jgi:hypothetical protein
MDACEEVSSSITSLLCMLYGLFNVSSRRDKVCQIALSQNKDGRDCIALDKKNMIEFCDI